MKTAVIKKMSLKISLSYQDICMSVTSCVHFTRCEWLEEEEVGRGWSSVKKKSYVSTYMIIHLKLLPVIIKAANSIQNFKNKTNKQEILLIQDEIILYTNHLIMFYEEGGLRGPSLNAL